MPGKGQMDFFTKSSKYAALPDETEPIIFSDLEKTTQSDSGWQKYYTILNEAWKTYRFSVLKITLCLGLVIVSAGLGALWAKTQQQVHIKAPPTVVPEVPYVFQKFVHDEAYIKEPTRDGGKLNETWDALLPPGRGFVLIRDHEKYSLTPGLPTGDGYSRFSISMFHQLHCLDYVRKTIYEIILQIQENRKEEIFISEIDQVDHIPHCIDYIRQGIMCAGDTAMEGATYDRHRTVLFGLGNPHRCKDFQAIYDFTAENYETVF